MPENYEFSSLDVIGMYPNIPHSLVLEALDRKWENIEQALPISKNEFLNGINFLLNSAYFQFNGKFYK